MKPFIRTGLIASAIAFLLTAGAALYTWNALPAVGEVPVHWGPDGRADQFAAKSEAWIYLAILPGSILFISLILALVPLIDPRKQNIETGRRAYLATWIATLFVLVLVQGGISVSMLKSGADAEPSSMAVRLIIAACAALFIVIGNYLPKTRPSFMFGIRTPWTLSSDTAWEKTHRFAGPLFMLAGGLGLLGAFVFSGIWLALQLSVLVISVALASVVYSYFAWRGASDRDAGTGLTI
ncbi:SdpI family protein [Hyphomonas sp. WL0036]|uniref:SdpI family protein n=1 Tax=Hyphomonas sediminis TaxID=2866160 RepID=UPI001C816C0B|nr:SdpI family protein [Hyphomonas sediminis]MBY9066257.1 SdpI family protein [Hyphomonas sediminis]